MTVLTLQPYMWATQGGMLNRDEPIAFDVVGDLPETVFIARDSDQRWMLFLAVGGVTPRQIGDYASPEDALAAFAALPG